MNDTELRLYYGGCLDIGCIRVPADADIVSVDILPSEEGADQDACTIAILWASRIDHTLNFSRLSLDLPLVSIDRLARAYTAVHALLKHVYEAIADHIDQWAEAKAVGQKWCDRIDGASSTYHREQRSLALPVGQTELKQMYSQAVSNITNADIITDWPRHRSAKRELHIEEC